MSFIFEIAVPPSDAPTSLWVPHAIEDEWQHVVGERWGGPDSTEKGTDPATGNVIHYTRLPAASTDTRVELEVTVQRRQRVNAHPAPRAFDRPPAEDPRFAPFLRADEQVRIDGPNAERARAIASPDEPPIVIARKLFDSILAGFTYDSGGCTPERCDLLGNLEQACDLRTGTCTELHGLFVAFARALGVPARFNFGFNVPRDKREGRIAGYHCWSEIALPDGSWFPVDVSEARKQPERTDFYFGSLDENRIAFTYGRDATLVPPQQGGTIDRFIFPYAESAGLEVRPSLGFRFVEPDPS